MAKRGRPRKDLMSENSFIENEVQYDNPENKYYKGNKTERFEKKKVKDANERIFNAYLKIAELAGQPVKKMELMEKIKEAQWKQY